MIAVAALSLMLSWVQVRSDTFVVKSSAGEERARRVLAELENFHQLIGLVVFAGVELPEIPIEVLIIGDEQTMNELRPVYNGRKLPVAGYYQRGPDRDFIVLSGRIFPDTLTRIVYHELTHYFLSRRLSDRPVWLSEGLAEYFATAEIRDDDIWLGELSPERMQTLKTSRLLDLQTFFAVEANSPYYNETLKANIFYAQAWAFVHFLMHSEHEGRFKQYLAALGKGDASLLSHLKLTHNELESQFNTYLRLMITRVQRRQMQAQSGRWSMKVESIPDTDAITSISEIFFATGNRREAQRRLEELFALSHEFPRASYYRGLLARISGEPDARDWFIDALTDPHLSARAAVQLVEIGDKDIPAVRTVLEEAAAKNTRYSDVYLSLYEIYLDDARRVSETNPLPPGERARVPRARVTESIEPQRYSEGSGNHIKYRLLSHSSTPKLETFIAPMYPAELRDEKISGEVVVDIQLTEEGKVAGIWLISATDEIFSGLATTAVRQWRFEPIPAKIRVILEFTP